MPRKQHKTAVGKQGDFILPVKDRIQKNRLAVRPNNRRQETWVQFHNARPGRRRRRTLIGRTLTAQPTTRFTRIVALGPTQNVLYSHSAAPPIPERAPLFLSHSLLSPAPLSIQPIRGRGSISRAPCNMLGWSPATTSWDEKRERT